MPTAATKLQPDQHIWAVSADAAGADARRGQLADAGVLAGSHTDLEWVLSIDPAVVLVDPTGWEARCRRILEELADRTSPPPAVLFMAPDPTVQVTAGPAFGYLPDNVPARDLTAAVNRARRARKAFLTHWPGGATRPSASDESRIKDLLRRLSGIDVRADRQNAFESAVRTRMVARLTPRAREYADLLERSQGDYGELELLCQLLVIGETYFWRYAGQFRALQETLVPQFTRSPDPKERCFRVWSAGTSTGEEAYSLAIACRLALPPSWQFEVHGTDIDRVALARAARAEYGNRTLRNLPPEVRRAHLEERDGICRVRDRVRAAVRFHHLNLAAAEADTWASRHGPFHAVFCRNVLIYFSDDEVERVVRRFEKTLVPGGGLFLGASETLYRRRPGMEVMRGSGCFFFRKVDPKREPARERLAPVAPVDATREQGRELYSLGLSRLDMEDFAGAGEAFAELLELCPDDARGHTGMALLLANQGREQEAGEHLGRAARCSPDLAESWYLRGLVAERAGQDGEALSLYGAALARAPEFFMAHINRAWILERMGRGEQGRSEMRAAFEILKERPPVSRWLTGGLGREALLDLVGSGLRERRDGR